MRRSPALWTLAGALAAVSVLIAPQLQTASAAPQPAPAALSIYRVPAASDAAAQRLLTAGFDVLEKREAGDLFVLGDAATAGKLRAAGFAPKSTEALKPANWTAPSTMLVPGAKPLADPVDETYYHGYHTVRAQYAHLDKVAGAFPDLTRVVDYGDSYLKTKNAATGYDLKTICITHKTADYDCKLYPGAPKPRFVLMTQMHAREIISGDFSWKFIDYLTKGYDKDPAVKDLLNTTEVWVIPTVNPDGIDLVQQGGNQPILQRKNLDGTGCSSGQRGVDLNRNTSTHWGTSGIDFNKCSEVYPGPNGDSEPETKALQTLYRQLFADQRGPKDTDPAPATAKGTLISIHSFAGKVLFPWGWNNSHAPNDSSLRAIGNKMGQLLGYEAGQPGEVLYNASGNIEDWTYGELGVAPFTIEAASCGSFTPSYSCASGEFTKTLPALMYVAGKAKAPYKP